MQKLPLFYLCGAQGIGLSDIAEKLKSRKNARYLVINGVIRNAPAWPEQRGTIVRMWQDTCFDISAQTERAVVHYNSDYICVSDENDQDTLDVMHFITIVCDEEALKKITSENMGKSAGKKIVGSDMTWLDYSLIQNKYFQIYHDEHQYKNMVLIDSTDLTPDEVAEKVEKYIIDTLDQTLKNNN